MKPWLLSLVRWFLPSWRYDPRPDAAHFFRRTLCSTYQKKRAKVKVFWITAALFVMINPVLPLALVVGLFTTFLSFMYLDES